MIIIYRTNNFVIFRFCLDKMVRVYWFILLLKYIYIESYYANFYTCLEFIKILKSISF